MRIEGLARVLLALGLGTILVGGSLGAQRAGPPLNELATTIGDGFTMASVGDMLIAYPASQKTDPAFASLLKIVRDADVATANYEASIIDGSEFKGSSLGPFAGTPDVAPDVKAMGFDIVARSNNHIAEFGFEGLRETNARLKEAGIVVAGSGDTYWAARAPRFVSTPKGRVGLVATASSFAQTMMAMPPRGEWPGRGGQSALRTQRVYVVPPGLMQSVRNIHQAFPAGSGLYAMPASDTEVTILGTTFRTDSVDKPRFSYRMNEQDLRDILAMVREGKAKSDFMAVAIHAHETMWPGEPDIDPSIPDFLQTFARATIDAGADAFLGSGVHVARGIEIYKGRPIFYGLGEFFRQMDTIGIAATGCTGQGGAYELDGSRPCRGDRNSDPLKYENYMALTRFDKGTLSEIRLYPTDLGHEVRMAHRGTPRAASPEVARRVLARLQKLSEPLGTTISIEGNVGVIRPGTAPVSSGAAPQR